MTEKERKYLYDLERRIEDNDVYAMEEWASFYLCVRPELMTEEIVEKIVCYYNIAIDNGHTRAALNLGAMYYSGTEIERDYLKAIELYKIAAESDDEVVAVRAICNLGYCYCYGRDVEVDYKQAYEYFVKGAMLYDDVNCLYKLGDMYRFGNFVDKDLWLAHKMYRKAYEYCGDENEVYADVLKRMGECYYWGIGTEKDLVSALMYYTKAQAYLYEKIYRLNDPFAAGVLAKTEEMIEKIKEELK